LEPSRGIDRITRHRYILPATGIPGSTHHFPGIHSHPDLRLDLPSGSGSCCHRLDRSLHSQGTEHRSLGIIFMRDGSTKEGKDGIPGILLHHAAIALDLPAHGTEVIRLDVPNFFRIEGLGEGGKADQVTEEGGH
jgi:hypothetical protein